MSSLLWFDPWLDGLIFGLGALFGSFFALCVHRMPRELSVVRPASHCDACKKPIPWYYNIPLFSYVWLRGRCAFCKVPFGVRNWLIEWAGAFLALLLWKRFGLPLEKLVWLSGPEFARALWPFLGAFAFYGALLVAALIDFETMYLPNIITIPGMVLGAVFAQLLPGSSWALSIIGALVGSLAIAGLRSGYKRLTGREGVGLGDVYLMGMIGGFVSIRLLPLVMLLASIQGSVIGVIYLAFAKKNTEEGGDDGTPMRHQALPFGPFLALAALEATIWGDAMLLWYLGRLG